MGKSTIGVMCLVICGWSSTAAADVKSDVYADVKTIITDLITKEVAENTVEEIACRASHAAYTPSPGEKTPDYVIGIEVGEPKKTEYYELRALKSFPGTMRRFYAGQFAGLKTTLRSEAADFAGHFIFLLLEETPAGKASTSNKVLTEAQKPNDKVRALFKDPDAPNTEVPATDVEKTLTTAVADIDASVRLDALTVARMLAPPSNEQGSLFTSLDKSAYGAMPDGRHALCKKAVLAKLKTGIGTTPSQLDEECGGKVSFRCEFAFAVRSAIVGDDAAARQHVTRAFADLINDAKVEAVASLLASRLGTESLADVKTAFAQLVTDWDTVSPLIHQLRMIATSSTRLDMSQVRSLAHTADAICKANASFVGCRQLDKLRNAEPVKRLLPLLEAAMRGDTQETVHLVVELILQRNRSSAECDNVKNKKCTKSVYESFFETLAYYVIDVASSGGASEDTRAAFRSAAEDVIRQSWPGGYQRGGYWGFRWRPEFALRTSWNEGYVSPDGSSYRTVAAVPLLLWRYPAFYTNMVYVGGHASLLDALSPLAEFSLRPNAVNDVQAHYTNSNWVWANAIAPRVAVEFALPPLSNHLMLDVGASYRIAVAYPVAMSTSGMAEFEYRIHGDTGYDGYRHLELSLTLKYAP